MEKIVVIGGGEIGNFETLPFDKRIVELTKKKHPKALFIPTASGEPDGYIQNFNKVYGKKLGCKTDVLFLLKTKPTKKELREKILSSDLIYVGGGNTLKMMKRWRFLGVDKILKEAHKRGIVLSGISAGGISWFEAGHSDSMSSYNPDNWDYIKVRGVITEVNGLRTIEHSGRSSVFTSKMLIFPELDRAVVILTNVNSGVFYSGVRDLFDGIVRITAGRRPGSYRRQDWTVRLGIIAFMVAEVLITACLIVVWARSKFARGLSCSRTRVALCVLNITVPVFVSWTLLRWSGISLLTLLNLEPDIGIALAASATMLVSASPLWLVCQVMPTLR